MRAFGKIISLLPYKYCSHQRYLRWLARAELRNNFQLVYRVLFFSENNRQQTQYYKRAHAAAARIHTPVWDIYYLYADLVYLIMHQLSWFNCLRLALTQCLFVYAHTVLRTLSHCTGAINSFYTLFAGGDFVVQVQKHNIMRYKQYSRV